ncbi:MAG: tRNA (adenosine(37)-N6)-dimethylallyltransferase MiaA [Pseudomonadota bacterium]
MQTLASPTASLFALVGPTASGKTNLALELCQRFPFEIISVDSALVYRDMNIGTAKPTPEERSRVPHHLIDICSPVDAYSAAQFVEDTQLAIQRITERGHWPLLVGGTFLYLNALINGLSDLPTALPEYRAQLDAEALKLGWPILHNRLRTFDPITAERIDPNDRQRIQRALEIIYQTGKPLAEAFTERKSKLKQTPIIIGLDINRSLLHDRIAERFATMVRQGLLNEVTMLKKHYPALHSDLPSMRCVGYRQAWQYLKAPELNPDWIERGIIATRQLAKRQITWMRHFKGAPIHFFDPISPQVLNQLSDFISNHYECL